MPFYWSLIQGNHVRVPCQHVRGRNLSGNKKGRPTRTRPASLNPLRLPRVRAAPLLTHSDPRQDRLRPTLYSTTKALNFTLKTQREMYSRRNETDLATSERT